MRSTTHARAGPRSTTATTNYSPATAVSTRNHRCWNRSSSSTFSSSSTSSFFARKRSPSPAISVAATPAEDSDEALSEPRTRKQEDAEVEPVLVLPRVMMLPDDEEISTTMGSSPLISSSLSSSAADNEPLRRVQFGSEEEDSEVSRWALKSQFSGKMAVLALAAMLIGERITGRGAVQALDLAVGVPLWEIEPVLALIVGGLLLAGLTPPRKRRPRPPGSRPTPIKATIQALMLRAAHLGLAAAIVSEVATGQGALALLELETGLGEVSELEAVAAFVLLVLLTNPGSGDGSGGVDGAE